MRIGELGRRAGVSPRALRHYEELGLLAAQRRANGYRDYGERDVALVAEIRSLVDLGFALEETRPFVECLRAGHPTGVSCESSRAVQRRKLAEVDGWLARLHAVRSELVSQLAPPAGSPPHVSTAQIPAERTGEPPEYVRYEGRLADAPSRNLDPPIHATDSRRGAPSDPPVPRCCFSEES